MAANPSTHTRNVALLRRLLLGAAVLAALALIGLSNTQRFSGAENGTGTLRLTGTGPVIDNPDYQGRTATGRAYQLTGETARADDNKATILRAPRLVLAATPSDAAVDMTAGLARLVSGEMADLQEDVRVTMSDGYILTTQKLLSDLRTQTLTAPQAISLDGPDMALRAASLHGQLDTNIYTLRDVRLRLQPQETAAETDK